MSQLLLLNPKRRRKAAASKKRRSGKRRSAAQVAATRRLVALNKGIRRNPTAKKRRRKSTAVAAAPRRTARRSGRRSAARSFSVAKAYSMNNIVPMLKSAAVGGAGAVVNDMAYAQAGRILPASVMSPVNADGSTNWLYFGGKAAMAIAIGTLGRKVPVVGKFAPRMAEGALDVLAYQVLRGVAAQVLPASIQLAAYNPVPLMSPRRLSGNRLAAYVPNARQLGAYVSSNVAPIRAGTPAKKLA